MFLEHGSQPPSKPIQQSKPAKPMSQCNPASPLLALLIALTSLAATATAEQSSAQPADCPATEATDAGTGDGAPTDQAQRSAAATKLTRDPSRYLSATQAAELLSAGTAVLVDLRRPDAYAEQRVPGSLNIPAHQIKTKAFLKGRRVLLLDAGHAYRQAERTAAELAARGFADVRIVEGGIGAWRSLVGPLAGVGVPVELPRVAPMDLLAELAYDHWQVLLAEGADQGDLEMPGDHPPIPAEGDPDALKAQIEALANGDQAGLRPLLLLVTPDGSDYPRLRAQLRDLGRWNLFFLDGGLAALERERLRLRLIRDRREARRDAPSRGCATRR